MARCLKTVPEISSPELYFQVSRPARTGGQNVLIMDEFTQYPSHIRQSYSVPHFGYKRLVVSAIVIFLSCSSAIVPPSNAEPLQSPGPPESSNGVCQATTDKELILDCSYRAGSGEFVSSPHLRLIHASLSFEVKGENYMSLSLHIANEDTVRLAERRTAFIEIDDAKGNNYLRRPLPHTDLGLVEPGKTRTFSEKLLVGSFLPGDYIISLWIPSPEPEETYNSRKNFLLRGENVADPETALNKLAHFTVLRSSKR
jgi:hypothetical protein